MSYETFMKYWERAQKIADISGDSWMSLLTGAYILRILGPFKGYPPVTVAEATVYGTAVGCFAYSNSAKGPKV